MKTKMVVAGEEEETNVLTFKLHTDSVGNILLGVRSSLTDRHKSLLSIDTDGTLRLIGNAKMDGIQTDGGNRILLSN